jgi:hypothetical protein
MTALRLAIGLSAMILCLVTGAILRGPQPGSAPRIATPTLTVRDATTLIATHLIARRTACATPAPDREIDIAGFGDRTVSTWHLQSCLHQVDALDCTEARRWSGAVNEAEPDAPHACLVMLGLADARESL